MAEADEKRERCQEEIFPSWSNRWIKCGSALDSSGRCYTYGHKRREKADG